MDRQPIISAKDVEITFSLRGRKLNAIRKCSLDLYEGETLAIVGESGSGKSVIYITHDLGGVANVADRVAVMYAGQIVEYGTVEEIFYDAWHPYTWALLQALPQLGTKGEALPSVDGTPPNLFNEIKGDAFAPRNKHALAIDFVQEPPFFQVSETHAAKTWYLDPRAPKIERPHSIQNLREKMGKMGGANLNG